MIYVCRYHKCPLPTMPMTRLFSSQDELSGYGYDTTYHSIHIMTSDTLQYIVPSAITRNSY